MCAIRYAAMPGISWISSRVIASPCLSLSVLSRVITWSIVCVSLSYIVHSSHESLGVLGSLLYRSLLYMVYMVYVMDHVMLNVLSRGHVDYFFIYKPALELTI